MQCYKDEEILVEMGGHSAKSWPAGHGFWLPGSAESPSSDTKMREYWWKWATARPNLGRPAMGYGFLVQLKAHLASYPSQKHFVMQGCTFMVSGPWW
jgi:hypothetical protein